MYKINSVSRNNEIVILKFSEEMRILEELKNEDLVVLIKGPELEY